MLQQCSQATFHQNFQTNNFAVRLKFDKKCLLSIHFENWIWIWIVNHIFVMDLDWIDNPKKLD